MVSLLKYDLSIIIPCYNEEKKIDFTLGSIIKYVKTKNWNLEIIIANDGSTDHTIDKVKEFQTSVKTPSIRVVEHYPNKGRGAILTKTFLEAKGIALIYMDADLATDLVYLDQMVQELNTSHVVTGSRLLKNSITSRPLSRTILSRGYNYLVRIFLRDGIKDHQCGFKGFQHEIVLKLLPEMESKGWFWDTEILVLAKKSGLLVKEIPIKWSEHREKGESKVKIGKTIKEYLIQILWLRRKIKRMKNSISRV